MKLENKTQKVATMSHFAKRMVKYTFFAFLLIGFSMGMDIVGYHYSVHIS